MKRVMIVGQPGSGKSTLAIMLGEATGLPVFHMDKIHWMAGWVMRPDAARERMAKEVEDGETWIFEGGFSRTYDRPRDRADTLVWVATPFLTRLWRVTWRFIRDFGTTRPDMADGCPEGNFREMIDFYRFIWRTRHTSRARIERLIAEAAPDLDVHVLRNTRAVAAFVRSARA